jgi:protocatechuate 3,4-dioxygenase beta subunit
MDGDDRPVGRVLTRRELVGVLTAGGVAMVAGLRIGSHEGLEAVLGAVPSCAVRPELTVGPYFVDHQLNRGDIRSEPSTGAISPGVPLALAFNVSQIAGGRCVPLPGAVVDVWQCDARGVYSGVADGRLGIDTAGQRFLRGYQVTGSDGRAAFQTIYPGWYVGRAVHIHFKIRTSAAPAGAYEFTSQLFFDDELTDRLHQDPAYDGRRERRLLNAGDSIYRQSGGRMLVSPIKEGSGYAGSFDIALDLSDVATGRPDILEFRGRGRARRNADPLLA